MANDLIIHSMTDMKAKVAEMKNTNYDNVKIFMNW